MPYPYMSLREWIAEEEKLGNVLRIETPIKCGDYNNIVDIGNDIPGKQPETELRAVVRYLHTLPNKPMAIVERPINNRPDIPVVLNPWPNRQRTLSGLGLADKNELCEKLRHISANKIKPVQVPKSQAPCKEVVIREGEIDLNKNIPRCWIEFNQMLWSTVNGLVIVHDPKTGTHDIGKLRSGMYDWKNGDPANPFPEEMVRRHMYSTLIYLGPKPSNAGRFYCENYKKFDKSMPAALVFGLPTDFHMVASFKSFEWPGPDDEYDLVGGFGGRPIELVASETIPGLLVPAHAEWVIEGEYLPEDEIMPPLAEDIASGYIFGSEACPKFRVRCISHRKNPWWDATTFSSSGSSFDSEPGTLGTSHEGPHFGFLALSQEVPAINFLRDNGFKVKDIVKLGGGREVVVVQLEVDGADKPYPHYGKQVLMALHGNQGGSIGRLTKYLIVVGPDINPYDFNDVMWALGTRSMPVSDSIIIEKGLAEWGDPSAYRGPLGWKTYGEQIMIDGLIKVPERYDDWPPRAEPTEWEKEAVRRIKKKLKQPMRRVA